MVWSMTARDFMKGHVHQCLWRSEKTHLFTEWFELADDKLRVHFDCFGKKAQAEKWPV